MDIVLPHFASQNEVKRCPFKTLWGCVKRFRRLRRRKEILNEHCFHRFCFAKSMKTVFVQNIIWRRKPPKDGLRPFYTTPFKTFFRRRRRRNIFHTTTYLIQNFINFYTDYLDLLRKIKVIELRLLLFVSLGAPFPGWYRPRIGPKPYA